MESTARRAAGLTGRDNPETLWPTRNATSSGKQRSARVCVTAMTRAELGRKVGRTEVINATPGVNLRLLSITEFSTESKIDKSLFYFNEQKYNITDHYGNSI